MPVVSRTFQELNQTSVNRLVQLGYTDAQYAGTGIRTLIESVNFSMAQFYQDMQANLSEVYLSRASGDALDALGLLVGCVRYAGETDTSYRFRITNSLTNTVGTNLQNLMQVLLTMTGIRDVIVKPFAQGIGTVGYYIIGTSGQVSSDLIALAKSNLDNYSAAGTYNFVTTPNITTVNVSGVLTIGSQYTASDLQDAQNAAISAVISRISLLSMGDTLYKTVLEDAALNAAASIINFQLLTISTTDSSGVTTERLLQDYIPKFDEQLVAGIIQIT